MRLLPIVLAAGLLVAACAARAEGPPELVVDRTVCSHCGMLVSEPIYAAAFRTPGTAGRVFDDIGCLQAAARQTPDATARYWFHDAAQGGWIEGTEAVFMTAPGLRTPMGGGVLAYGDATDAEKAARAHGGEVVPTLAALLGRNGGTQ
jgi:copper chaperone NosL